MMRSFLDMSVWLAFAVLVSHNFVMVGLREPTAVSGHTIGAVAVLVFFSISGYLVAQSLERSGSVFSFATKRILRIYPGLMVALVVCAVIIGPLFTTLPLQEYFRSEVTWRSILRFFGVPGEDRLPGVFESNPHPGKVNESLWTIKYELICYAILAVVGLGCRLAGGFGGARSVYLVIFATAFVARFAASIFNTARSLEASDATTVAGNSRSSERCTVICDAPSTT